jgi:hypothetical protein
MPVRILLIPSLVIATSLGGCVAAAAGAGAAGAIYVVERGVESTIPANVTTSELAAKRAFREMGIAETRSRMEQEGGTEMRIIDGRIDDREIQVTIETAGTGSKVVVVARKSAVTWDKDLARSIMERIIEGTK